MILPIVAYGDPVLRKECEEIEENHEGLSDLIANMFETMYEANGVGLAAPQIGQSLRLFIVDASSFAEPDDDGVVEERGKGLEDFKKVFINPIIEEETGEKWGFREGCLSIPEVREDVYRHSKILVTYFDENFKFHEETFDGYAARVIQHEYDHVEGVLFTDYLSAFKRRLVKRRLNDISKGQVSVNYRMKFPNRK
jgi:peptide deformylase